MYILLFMNWVRHGGSTMSETKSSYCRVARLGFKRLPTTKLMLSLIRSNAFGASILPGYIMSHYSSAFAASCWYWSRPWDDLSYGNWAELKSQLYMTIRDSCLWFIDWGHKLSVPSAWFVQTERNQPRNSISTVIYIIMRFGALSIQQKFRFAILEIIRAQWNGLTSSNFIFARWHTRLAKIWHFSQETNRSIYKSTRERVDSRNQWGKRLLLNGLLIIF